MGGGATRNKQITKHIYKKKTKKRNHKTNTNYNNNKKIIMFKQKNI